jgi:hypothetical protein
VGEEKVQEVLRTAVVQEAGHQRKQSVDKFGMCGAVQKGSVSKVSGTIDDKRTEDTTGDGAKLEREVGLLGQRGHKQDRVEGKLSISERFNERNDYWGRLEIPRGERGGGARNQLYHILQNRMRVRKGGWDTGGRRPRGYRRMRSEVQGENMCRNMRGSILIKRGEQEVELRELSGGRGSPLEVLFPYGRAAQGRGADGWDLGGGR